MRPPIINPYTYLVGDVGLPSEFPAEEHVAVHLLVCELFAKQGTPEEIKQEYYGAWNAVLYRFKAAWVAEEEFRKSVSAYGDAPGQPMRYEQENSLFNFAMAAESCLEALHYAVFAISAAYDPTSFPFSSPDNRRDVNPGKLRKLLASHGSAEDVVRELKKLADSAEWKQLDALRRILFHRISPGREISLSIGEISSMPSNYRNQDIPWQMNVEPHLLTDFREWLTNALRGLLVVLEAWLKRLK